MMPNLTAFMCKWQAILQKDLIYLYQYHQPQLLNEREVTCLSITKLDNSIHAHE